jgi:ABC-type branched-subunit amino acid transport system ATPase component
MHVLIDWSAKRAGATMTITGKNGAGETVKLTGISEIVSRPDVSTMALDKRRAGTRAEPYAVAVLR